MWHVRSRSVKAVMEWQPLSRNGQSRQGGRVLGWSDTAGQGKPWRSRRGLFCYGNASPGVAVGVGFGVVRYGMSRSGGQVPAT